MALGARPGLGSRKEVNEECDHVAFVGVGCLLSALYPVCVGCLYDLYEIGWRIVF